MLIALVLLGVARAEPDASAEAVLAHVEQVDVPAWKARVETAERQTAARTAFFAGEASFDAAFPGLATVRLGNPTVVRGRLADLQARATAREAERLEPAIEGLSPEVAAPFLAQRRAALDAEEAADALLRRLLTRVEAVLGAHPELTDAAVEGILAETREALARVPPEDPVQAEAFAVEVAHADAELARTDAFRRALLVHALGGGPA
ncbi:MAG: hypothetical protein KC656_22495, partial [Myxococcales bacterium]|nr:hypothetical protein [Myxococcales bacterium]